ncbi:hypothetical protein DCAR_0518639 [Daucus carota subsp. sativus]|uniref:F-box domain-containing protein n=1 Tax=Daucus carota subsp. sativus TaxID=79200 RepID=A0AAF0X2C3_DAUCS|nr:hypothetical protein DCAR_0518639 [Daucus carota subsp. sativus]
MATKCEDLPEECWGITLKKLDHHSQFQSLSLVSKSFLALTNRFRLNFTLTNQTILLHRTISNSLGTGPKLPELEVLSVAGSGFSGKGLKTISQRCSGILRLDLEGCVAATTQQVEELVTMCGRLREINLRGCHSVEVFTVANRIVSLRRSYLKVIPPSTLPFSDCRKHLCSHGCLLE